jgi:hypothetical protein
VTGILGLEVSEAGSPITIALYEFKYVENGKCRSNPRK